MARSADQCAQDRAGWYDSEIRKALKAGDPGKALRLAADYMLAEGKKRRDRNYTEGALLSADAAALLRHIGAGIHGLPAPRLRNYAGALRPADLLEAYDAGLERAEGEES